MARKRKPSSMDRRPRPAPASSAGGVRVRRIEGRDEWELVPPRCARDRAEDLEEVRKMIDAGEIDVAIDELRWLLQGCGDFIDAHRLLGELALLEGDLTLARGHFGYAYQIGACAFEREKAGGILHYSEPANQAFFEAGKGLVHCLRQLGKPRMAREIVERLLQFDPSDPLGLREMSRECAQDRDE